MQYIRRSTLTLLSRVSRLEFLVAVFCHIYKFHQYSELPACYLLAPMSSEQYCLQPYCWQNLHSSMPKRTTMFVTISSSSINFKRFTSTKQWTEITMTSTGAFPFKPQKAVLERHDTGLHQEHIGHSKNFVWTVLLWDLR